MNKTNTGRSKYGRIKEKTEKACCVPMVWLQVAMTIGNRSIG
ncbi:hypothetical protein [Thermodesulfovibrio hydrogeniphilus]